LENRLKELTEVLRNKQVLDKIAILKMIRKDLDEKYDYSIKYKKISLPISS